MPKREPLVTVLLTVYNRPSVVKTIDSILAQSFTDFEFIIVDNASVDNTCDVIQQYKDDRIRLVINEKNMGQTYSLNRGLKLACGKYIARIDADDIALKDRLKKQVIFMESHGDYVFCGSWVRYINDEDKLTITMPMPVTDKGLRTMQLVSCGMYHPAAMIRRRTIQEYNIMYDPDIYMAEDYEMWRKLLLYGKGLNLGEVLVHYRRGNNNDSTTHQETMGKECFIIRKRMCREWDNKEEAKRMLRIIGIEEKNKKTFAETMVAAKFYKGYLDRNLRKDELDYKILKKKFFLKVYASFIHCNNAIWARVLNMMYSFILSTRYRIGKKGE